MIAEGLTRGNLDSLVIGRLGLPDQSRQKRNPGEG